MKLSRFNNFKDDMLLENVQMAKKFLREKYVKSPDPKVDIDYYIKGLEKTIKAKQAANEPTEDLEKEVSTLKKRIETAERNPDFVKLRDVLLKKSPGLVYVFTKFLFDEEIPYEELEQLVAQLNTYKGLLNKLPRTVDKFTGEVDENGVKWGFEKLYDEVQKLGGKRNTTKLVSELKGELRREFELSSDIMKNKMDELANAFYELDEPIQNFWIKKISSFKNLFDFIKETEKYIKSSNAGGYVQFLDAIDKCNARLGELNGADIMYNENNIICLQLNSYMAVAELAGNTTWCIRQLSSWNSYVGGDEKYTKQYALFDFNLSPADTSSIIGWTVDKGDRTTAIHKKNDNSMDSSSFQSYLRKLGIPVTKSDAKDGEWYALKGMSPEEVDQKKRRVIASREIRKKLTDPKLVKKYIDDGADPNTEGGTPLKNAVQADLYDIVDVLVEAGASINIAQCMDLARDAKMVKYLMEKGGSVTPGALKQVIMKLPQEERFKVVEDMIEYSKKDPSSFDIGMGEGLPIRVVIRPRGRESVDKKLLDLIIKNGANPDEKNGYIIRHLMTEAINNGKIDEEKWSIVKELMKTTRINPIRYISFMQLSKSREEIQLILNKMKESNFDPAKWRPLTDEERKTITNFLKQENIKLVWPGL